MSATENPSKDSSQSVFRRIVACGIHETRTRNFLTELERRGCSITEFSGHNPFRNFRNTLSFLKAVRNCDFVLTGTPFPWLLAWIWLAKIAGRPCVVDCPMDLAAWPFPERAHVRWLVRLTLRSANLLLTIRSRQYLVEKFGLNKKRVLFLESCPDETRVSAAVTGIPRFQRSPDEFVICCSGGHEHHRLERFLPIFEEVVRLTPNATLLVIADPSKPIAFSARKLAESGKLSRNIQVLPVIKPVADFYATLAQCDLWIATLGDDTLQGSHEFRMELLEVGLLGKAVMAAPTAGLLDNGLSEGQEILYIQPEDVGPSAMKIAGLANHRQTLSLLGDNLQSYVKRHFSLSQAIDSLLQLPQLHRGAKEESRATRPDAVNTPVGQ